MRRYSATRGRRLTAYEATVERFVTTRPGAWAFVHLASPVDRRLVALTGARLSLAPRAPVGLLETTGARSGRPRHTALLYLADGPAVLLVASNGGRARHPAWLHNMRAEPVVRFLSREHGWRAYRARTARPTERERRWPDMLDLYTGYAAYQRRVTRPIPLVILEPA